MPLFFFTPIFKFLVVPALIALFLGGAYAYITIGAYNRGVKATVDKMNVLIERGAARVGEDLERVKNLPPDKLDEELVKLCLKHGGTKEKCRAPQ